MMAVARQHLDKDGNTVLMTQEEFDNLPRLEKIAVRNKINKGTARIIADPEGAES